LYLSYDGLTDPLGQSQILPYLGRLSRQGFRFTIISAEKEENYCKRRKLIEDVVKEYDLDWHPIFYTKSPPVLSTVWDLYAIWRSAESLHRQKKFDIVHCRSYLSALLGLRFKKKYRIKFIFDMRGFWADERVEGKLWNLQNPVFRRIYRFFKKQEKRFLRQADYTISLTTRARREMYSWPGLASIPIEVIPCCVDTDLFDPERVETKAQEAWRVRLNLGEKDFILVYLGAIGTWYMLEEMLDFFSCLLSTKPEARFLFVTTEEPETVLRLARSKGIAETNLRITPAERSEVPIILSLAHMAIFFIRNTYSKMASSPTKQGELMSMGIPVICNAGVGDTDEVIERYHSGLVVHGFERVKYEQIIAKISSLVKLDCKVIRQGALDFYSLEKGVEAYLKVYKELKN
jgi:glycosyltransferase involved in cell wall biosynthesis